MTSFWQYKDSLHRSVTHRCFLIIIFLFFFPKRKQLGVDYPGIEGSMRSVRCISMGIKGSPTSWSVSNESVWCQNSDLTDSDSDVRTVDLIWSSHIRRDLEEDKATMGWFGSGRREGNRKGRMKERWREEEQHRKWVNSEMSANRNLNFNPRIKKCALATLWACFIKMKNKSLAPKLWCRVGKAANYAWCPEKVVEIN